MEEFDFECSLRVSERAIASWGVCYIYVLPDPVEQDKKRRRGKKSERNSQSTSPQSHTSVPAENT